MNKAWWQADPPRKGAPNLEVARLCQNEAARREINQTQLRWRNLIFARHMTGRPDQQNFYYGMAKRPSTFLAYYSGAEFQPPTINETASCADVYINRLFREYPYITCIPERGDFEMREECKGLEQWLDGAMQTLGFWEEYPKLGLDGCENGTGWLKFEASEDKKMKITRPHTDEFLFANPDIAYKDQVEVIQRVWVSRAALMDEYRDNKEALEAIRTTPSAYPAFWFGRSQLDTSDVIPLLDCYKIPTTPEDEGRHVLCLQNYVFCDDPWKDPTLPYEPWEFGQMSSGVFGQGLVEQCLPLQDELDFVMSAISENIHRCSWPKWLRHGESGVNPRALGDTSGAIVDWSGPAHTKPEIINPEANREEVYAWVEALRKMIRERAHISEMQGQGQVPTGLRSAPAIDRFEVVQEQVFAEKGTRLEEFAKRCALQLIRLGSKVKPEVKLAGRQVELVKWNGAWARKDKPIGLSVFGASRLPQTPAGRRQELSTMLANGEISKTIYARFSQIADVDEMLDIVNAPADLVDKELDGLLKEYNPPTPFVDLQYALGQCESRYCYEKALDSPQDILDRFLLYRSALKEMITEQSTPPAMPAQQPGATPAAGPGFGNAVQAAPALAPSPPQIAPDLGAAAAPTTN